MSKIKRIITSEVEGRNLSDFYGDNSYSFDSTGQINYYGENKMGPVIEPGIVYGSNADSGDGYGYNTIKLVPHSPDGYINDDRYLIIDPTAPNHIHIRAGGTQDQSNAELYLGGEKNYVLVDDSASLVSLSSRKQQHIQAIQNINNESNDYIIFTDYVANVSTNGWYVEINGQRYYVASVSYPTEGQTMIYVPGAPAVLGGIYNIFSPDASNVWDFNTDGTIYGPGDQAATKFTRVETTNNGAGQNVKIGDDAWIGDVDTANHIAITGVQDATSAGIILGNTQPGTISVGEGDMSITSSGAMRIEAVGGDMNFWMDGAAYIGPSASENRIVRIQDLVEYTSPTETRWSPVFEATGLTFTGSNSTYPTYNSYYLKFGKLVTFNIAIDLSTVTNFGTGQFKTELPFLPIPSAANHFSAWAWVDPSQPADELNGHIQMVADHLPNSQVLDLHWLKETTATPKPLIESLLVQGTPVTFTTASKIYINGTYICA